MLPSASVVSDEFWRQGTKLGLTEVIDVTTTYDGVHVRRSVHNVGEGDAGDAGVFTLRDAFQNLGHPLVRLGLAAIYCVTSTTGLF